MAVLSSTLGTLLCMNATVDLHLVQQHVNALKTDLDKMAFEVENEREAMKKALHCVEEGLEKLEKRVSKVEQEHQGIKHSVQCLQDEQSAMGGSVKSLKSDVDKLAFEVEDCGKTVQKALQDVKVHVDLEERVVGVEQESKSLKRSLQGLQNEQIATDAKIKSLKLDQDNMQQRVLHVEEQMSHATPQISSGNETLIKGKLNLSTCL